MSEFLFALVTVSLTVSAVGGLLILLSPLINKTFPLGWKRVAWLLLGLRLLLPVSLSLPQAPITVEVPSIPTIQRPVQAINPSAGQAPEVNVILPSTADRGALVDTHSPVPVTPSLMIFLVWITVAFCVLLWGILRYLAFRRRALRWSLPATASLLKVYQEAGHSLGLKNLPPLRIAKQVTSPMLAGLLKPVVLLPPQNYDTQELELILCHELVHYQRKDTWLGLLMQAARALHWFNPLVYLIANQSDRDMELACDERVVEALGHISRKRYGALILESAAAQTQRPLSLTTGFNPGKKRLTERITNMMQLHKRQGGKALLSLTVAVTLLIGLLVACVPQVEFAEYPPLLSLEAEDYETMTVAQLRTSAYDEFGETADISNLSLVHFFEIQEVIKDTSLDNISLQSLFQNFEHSTIYAMSTLYDGTELELEIDYSILNADKLTLTAFCEAHENISKGLRDGLPELWETAEDEPAQVLSFLSDLAQACSNDLISFEIYITSPISDNLLTTINNLYSDDIGPASPTDYDTVLALRFPGYESMSVAAYSKAVQVAFNEANTPLPEAYSRVAQDSLNGTIPHTLTQEELFFLNVTLYGTIAEQMAKSESRYSTEEKHPLFLLEHWGDSLDYEIIVRFDLAYQVLTPDTLSIDQRDRLLSDLLGDISVYLESREDSFWADNDAVVLDYVTKLCETYSNEMIRFSVYDFDYYYTPPNPES